MEKEKTTENNFFILEQIKSHISSQEKSEAHLLDYMQEHPELTPEPPAPPPGEFQKIMEEINRRGAETVVRRQLKALHYGHRFVDSLQKPLLIAMIILILLMVSVIGTLAR